MASPIAAGSVVVPRATLGLEIEGALAPLFGICESATPPVNPGDPPTNVVVAWSDGKRVTYVAADGLLQVLGLTPGVASILGSIVTINDAVVHNQIPHPGGRVQGPVVFHANLFSANGDPFQSGFNEFVGFVARVGYIALPKQATTVLPAA